MLRCNWTMRAACAAALALGLAGAPALGRPQWVPFDKLPNASRVQQVDAAARGGGGVGRVREVRWGDDGSLWFEYAGKWRRVPAAGGEPEETAEEPPKAAEEPDTYREPRGARGEQAASVPSPDGRWVAKCVNSNVVLEPMGKDDPPRTKVTVTTEGVGKLKYGAADWVYAEELDQNTAMWWSPDSSRLAYYHFDERPVKDFTLLGGLTTNRTKPMVSGYPKPGDPNGIARLEMYDVASGRRIPVDVGPESEQYIYGARWTPRGDGLLFFRTNRRQDTLDLVLANPASGETRVVLTERQPTFQKNSPLLRFLKDGRTFIWESEASGFSNLQLWNLDKGKVADLTKHPFVVQDVVSVDEDAGWVYYTARSSETPINSQLHRVRMDGTDAARLTRGDLHFSGFHIAPDHGSFVATSEFIDTPPRTAMYGMDGVERAVLAKPAPDFFAKRGLTPPEVLRFKAADGVTDLVGVVYKPSNYDSKRQYPLVVDTYGGPGVPAMSGRFRPNEAETEFGLLVAKVDNRGTPGRGKAFETTTYLDLGGKDVDDQAQLVRELIARGLVAPGRVAVTGHSYGGYMTLMCLLRYPDLFQVGVAGAPPTDWRQYDTIYTERYMRTPEENPEGYARSSAVERARDLRGQVLLVHGMVDDNVHPNNTFALADRWQRQDMPFEMMLFPTSAHGIGSPAYRSSQWSFILRHLGLMGAGDASPAAPAPKASATPNAAPAASPAAAPVAAP